MNNITRESIEWGGRVLTLETGRIANQADGAVLIRYGDTEILCTVVVEKELRAGIDFFPLGVHYIEKSFAAGKIPGGFFKREGRPSEKEILVSRLIDRPVRPLFHESFHHEVQIICTLLGHDLKNDPAIPAMIGTSAALAISGVPFNGPIAASQVGYIDRKFVLNPQLDQVSQSKLDLVVAGSEEAVLMVEAEASELPEDVMLDAMMFGQQQYRTIIEFIRKFAAKAAKPPMKFTPVNSTESKYYKDLKQKYYNDVIEAYQNQVKLERYAKLSALKEKATQEVLLCDGTATVTDSEKQLFSSAFKQLECNVLRGSIINNNVRTDGRKPETIRKITAEVGVIQRTHGSALFTRGDTQALVVTTIGTSQDEQIIDSIDGEYKEHFMLHYNFNPYSTGEVNKLGSPGRREIGHGKLAWRAIHPMLPSRESFRHSIRIVSEITGSNGSTSMATVCGAWLSMADAGIEIARPVAGIAMGLIKEEEKFVVLSDISADEDRLGDMDFKVAGTSLGITALQMDMKIAGISREVMNLALAQAKTGRLHILEEMMKTIDKPRTKMSQFAPKVTTMKINPDKIREVIGSGGKVIKEICEVTGTKIDIEQDGTISISSSDSDKAQRAVEWIEGIAGEPELGKLYSGKVSKVVEFGAFVNFMGSRDGLVHVSEMGEKGKRIRNVGDLVKVGDVVQVRVIGFGDRGKVRLKIVDPNQDDVALVGG